MAAKALKERDDVKVMTEEELEEREFELRQEQEEIRSLCSIVELDSLNQNACRELFTYLGTCVDGCVPRKWRATSRISCELSPFLTMHCPSTAQC